MTITKKPAASAAAAKSDATVLLTRDHTEVRKLFKQYERATNSMGASERQALAELICDSSQSTRPWRKRSSIPQPAKRS